MPWNHCSKEIQRRMAKRKKKKIESLEQFIWAAPGLPRFYRCLDGRPGEKRCL